MKTGMIAHALAWVGLTVAGCAGGAAPAADDINTTPATLTEGRTALEAIDHEMAEQGSTPELLAKQRELLARVDVLNGLVDSIDIAPSHTVDFFIAPDGTRIVGERMRLGMTPALQPGESIDAIYARLAPGRSTPGALSTKMLDDVGAPVSVLPNQTSGGSAFKAAPTTAGDGIETASSALSNTTADNNWFIANCCNSAGVWSDCVVSWTGGRSTWATSDHSWTNTAFTAGSGQINLVLAGKSGNIWQTAIPPGDLQFWWTHGPIKDVKDDPSCSGACGTNKRATPAFMKWSVTNATNKVFDFGARFYNNPNATNSP